MSSIVRFAPGTSGTFGPEVTQILGAAFDAACAFLGHTAQPTATRETIAKAILEAAKQGERDRCRLRDIGLAASEKSIGS